MARARNIKPGFYKNELLAECSIWARFIFPGLWQMADRLGRLEDRPKKIKGELLPYDSAHVDPLLQELHHAKFIYRYEVSGQKYIQILKFTKHQSPHFREPVSTIPAVPAGSPGYDPDGNGAQPEAPDLFHDREALGPPDAGPSRAPLNPESGERKPDAGHRTADSPSSASGGSGQVSRLPASKKTAGSLAWDAYAAAYERKYQTPPLRNGETNSKMARFVTLVGAEDAPAVAEFYLTLDKRYYIEKQHPVGALVTDASSIYTQWKTGSRVTETGARLADRTAENGAQASRFLGRK